MVFSVMTTRYHGMLCHDYHRPWYVMSWRPHKRMAKSVDRGRTREAPIAMITFTKCSLLLLSSLGSSILAALLCIWSNSSCGYLALSHPVVADLGTEYDDSDIFCDGTEYDDSDTFCDGTELDRRHVVDRSRLLMIDFRPRATNWDWFWSIRRTIGLAMAGNLDMEQLKVVEKRQSHQPRLCPTKTETTDETTRDRCVITCLREALGRFPALFTTLLLVGILSGLFWKISDLDAHCLASQGSKRMVLLVNLKHSVTWWQPAVFLDSFWSQQQEAKVNRTILSILSVLHFLSVWFIRWVESSDSVDFYPSIQAILTCTVTVLIPFFIDTILCWHHSFCTTDTMVISRLSVFTGTSPMASLLTSSPAARRNTLRMMSSTAKKGFNKAQLLNIVGLPLTAIILFVFLPTFTPGEVHSIDWYDKQNLERIRAREAAARGQ